MLELLDPTTVVSTLIAQAPLVVLLALILLFYMERGFHGVELAIRDLREAIGDLRGSVDGLIGLNEILLYMLYGRSVVTDVEYRALQVLLDSTRPQVFSRYYTEEVARRLGELLKMDINDYT